MKRTDEIDLFLWVVIIALLGYALFENYKFEVKFQEQYERSFEEMENAKQRIHK